VCVLWITYCIKLGVFFLGDRRGTVGGIEGYGIMGGEEYLDCLHCFCCWFVGGIE
jgi:hypothetical protein